MVSVPNGGKLLASPLHPNLRNDYLTGYVLGLMLQACIEHQSSTKHLDPIHVTAHFMRSAVVGEFEVHIRVLKSGRGFTNLSVQFMQQVRNLFAYVSMYLADVVLELGSSQSYISHHFRCSRRSR